MPEVLVNESEQLREAHTACLIYFSHQIYIIFLMSEDGYWKNWEEWGSCSLSCGGGVQYRDRDCVPALHGGTNCTGLWQEDRVCNDDYCPGRTFI